MRAIIRVTSALLIAALLGACAGTGAQQAQQQEKEKQERAWKVPSGH